MNSATLSPVQLYQVGAYWRAANYPSVGQLYLYDNALLRELQLPDFHEHALQIMAPGALQGQDARVLGRFLRDGARLNQDDRKFHIYQPDETVSNLLGAVFEATSRQRDAQTLDNDEFLPPDANGLPSVTHHGLRHAGSERTGPLPPRAEGDGLPA